MGYRDKLKSDPQPWLLEVDPHNPGVRASALADLLDRDRGDSDLRDARLAVMESGPVPFILSERDTVSHWGAIGPGGVNKYTGTVWQVIFLAALGANGDDPRIRESGEYLLERSQTIDGGLSAFGSGSRSKMLHCYNGDIVYALLNLGFPPHTAGIQKALDWQARAIIGQEVTYFKSGTSGPGFGCAINGGLPCAWGAVKALKALSLVPEETRTPRVRQAVEEGVRFLLSYNLATADYPAWGGKISSDWFKFGYPLGYTSDILEALDVLVALGYGADPRIRPAVDFVLSKQDEQGRWKLEHTLNGKMWVDIETKGQPSKWVTLRALRVLKGVFGG